MAQQPHQQQPPPIAFQQVDPIQGAHDFLATALRAADERMAHLAARRDTLVEEMDRINRGRKGIERAIRALNGSLKGNPPPPQRLLSPPPQEESEPQRPSAPASRELDLVGEMETWAATHGGVVDILALAGSLNLSRSAFQRAPAQLAASGRCIRISPGVYRVTPAQPTP